MTRTLVFIAFAGFLLAVACIAGAIALGGSALLHHHWARHWTVDWDHDRGSESSSGPTATREIAWTGGDRIDFNVPADVQYTQAPGPGKLVITGAKDQLDHIELSGSQLQNEDGDFDGRVSIVMTAPGVRHFGIDGDNDLTISGYDQDDLSVSVSGHGTVNAKGRTRAVTLDISGDGDMDMSGLAAQTAKAQISGSGHAKIAPTDEADLDISGSGEIDLLSRPAKVNSNIAGSGRIVEGAPAPATNAVAAPAAAAPPAKPS